MYIIVTDDKGFHVGCDSGVFKPASHRLLIEKGEIFGAEGLMRHFRKQSDAFNEKEWIMFVGLLQTVPTGVYGQLKWNREV